MIAYLYLSAFTLLLLLAFLIGGCCIACAVAIQARLNHQPVMPAIRQLLDEL